MAQLRDQPLDVCQCDGLLDIEIDSIEMVARQGVAEDRIIHAALREKQSV